MDFKPLSGREFPRFSGIKTFFRLPNAPIEEKYQIGIFGVPSDAGVSYRPGARFAPSHVREASSLGRGFHWNRNEDLFAKKAIADLGDCSVIPVDLAKTHQLVEDFVDRLLLQKKKFVAVGGDHSNTLPILRALKKHYKTPLAFVHFDAHLDTYPAAWGCEYHHGAFARHAIEEGLVDPKKMIQIGLRGPLATGADLDFVNKHGVRLFTVDDIRGPGGLSEFCRNLPLFDSTPTYISYDIDCLDPAFAPGTGTPVPGGLTTYEVQKIFQALKVPNLVGADIVEVCPAYDQSDITALAAVDALSELLHMM
jgi:guanidinopropionase